MMQFNLYLQSQGQTCQFRLTWGQGQSIAITVDYPTEVFQRYEVWQIAYLHYYRSFRARIGVSGIAKLPVTDRRSKLIQSEAEFLTSFQLWLNQAKLLSIRVELVKALQVGIIDLFITCELPEFERLPWEIWRESPEFFGSRLRIARTPTMIRSQVGERRVRSRLRILVILGDETGLNFQAERDALKALQRYADVQFIGWQGGKDDQLRSRIRAAITDALGWDLLFFAGHSNETALTGGELGIAPGESLMLVEILDDLRIAIDRGLQFAIFNSCKGLSIAQTLIDLGLSQVMIMREPIHNHVAQQFLLQFLQQFIVGADVDTAMRSACDTLQRNPNLDYPSSHWIPSLFRHPASQLLACPPIDRLQWLKQWKPDRWEASIIGSIAILSLLNPVQDSLMNLRQGMQMIYRLATGQVPNNAPPLRLVVIDDASINQAGIVKSHPINWKYLATILDRVATYQPKRVGLDVLLDKPDDHRQDQQEIPALQRSLQKFQQIPIVFASTFENGSESKISAELLTKPLSSMPSGYTHMADWHLPLLWEDEHCIKSCPFAMQLANPDHPMVIPVNPVTQFSRGFRQFWLNPIQDLSIPSDRIYQYISATELEKIDRSVLENQVVMVVASYKDAGMNAETPDSTRNIPLAIQWGTPSNKQVQPTFTGGEKLAYATHHFMTRHFVIPIPDVWGVLIAGTIAKIIHLRSRRRLQRWKVGLIIFGYGILGLQLYLSAKLLLPFLFPSITLGLLGFPNFQKVK
jgi:CHASE2 domain/CHAT domain